MNNMGAAKNQIGSQAVGYSSNIRFNDQPLRRAAGRFASAGSFAGKISKSGYGHRILLVEDNPDVADSMAMLLKLFGHEVLMASDGQQGVEMALQEEPTAILLDIGLPKMNGYEACQAIRQAGLQNIPIIAVTGYNQAEDRKKSQEAGFNEHMPKPVDMAELEKLLAAFPGRDDSEN